MIQVEKLSYGVPSKELYENISFSLEVGAHYALIGSNGCGKSTLVDMIMDPDEYLFDGKIIKDDSCRIGYASQFNIREKSRDCTVFEYLSESFVNSQKEIEKACEEMACAEDMDAAFEKYQRLMDIHQAMDGDNYESNIKRELNVAGLGELGDTLISQISGGEYKLVQIMKEMLLAPNLLILDEPDVFLDFANLSSLSQMINDYKGTLLVITHNRFLLNHCFDRILHLENGDLQEFEGSYMEYRCSLLEEKLRLKIQNLEEEEEIARTQEMVDILRKRATLMVNPVIGQSVNAKQSQLDRLKARQIKPPFIEIREPNIRFPEISAVDGDANSSEANSDEVNCSEVNTDANTGANIETNTDAKALQEDQKPKESQEKKTLLKVENYNIAFDEVLLENVSFDIKAGEKVAIVGANGTGKTTLVRDILRNDNPAVSISPDISVSCMSQLQGDVEAEEKTVYEMLYDAGLATRASMIEHLSGYCLGEDYLDQKIRKLSGGEQNLLQLALIGLSNAELLILDEPSSHLDIHAQSALEKAISEYKGTVLMVSHDFYLIANCADYVLFVDENTLRRMRNRNFRKMVYDKYFSPEYLEKDRKKQEIEAAITEAFKKNNLASVEKLCGKLAEM